MTITDFCCELNNFFKKEIYLGEFTIEGGRIALPAIVDIKDGQYFRIVGSVFNDGVYQHPATGLTEEMFQGAVWAMAVPPSALALFNTIKEWDTKYANDEVANSPYQSESFGGYSYSKGYNSTTGGSNITVSWQNQFKSRLNRWRKLR